MGFLPPSSNETFFNNDEAVLDIVLPVFVPPVNERLAQERC